MKRPDDAVYFSPPEVAERFRVKPGKILAMIRAGILAAVDMAMPGSRRPRFRISADAIREFEQRRAATGVVKIRRRKQQRRAVKSYV